MKAMPLPTSMLWLVFWLTCGELRYTMKLKRFY